METVWEHNGTLYVECHGALRRVDRRRRGDAVDATARGLAGSDVSHLLADGIGALSDGWYPVGQWEYSGGSTPGYTWNGQFREWATAYPAAFGVNPNARPDGVRVRWGG